VSVDPGAALIPLPVRGGFLAGVLRPKGNLSQPVKWTLFTIAFLPLLSVAIRVLAFPGVIGSGFGAIQSVGSALNQFFSLSTVPSAQRDHVLYLLFLPTSAMLVALARLTFGVRVLGFRSILISVGFHQSGILPSLLLITVAVATVVGVRPFLRRIGLPYYARVPVILCIVAVTMVGALLVGPWVNSEVVWGAAFFPVIVLGMLAEGIARTMDRESVLSASWSALMTVILAFLIALIGWVPVFRSALLEFPELVLTEIVAIVLISEYLELKLLDGWDKRMARFLMPRIVPPTDTFRVAVVRNRIETVAQGRAERRRDALRSVQPLVDALRKRYRVKVLEGDESLLKLLRKFLPPTRAGSKPRGIVLNLAHGARGDARASQVPAMLEMSGIPYVGPDPLGHAMANDRVLVRALLQEARIRTPAYRATSDPEEDVPGLRFPLAIYPRREPNAKACIVKTPRQLKTALSQVLALHGRAAVIEEHVGGRRISAAVLGNDPPKVLPLVELESGTGTKICPAKLDRDLARKIRVCARKAFRACGCRDYARIDLRVSESGRIWVIEVATLGILSRGGAFVLAGREADLPFNRLVRQIVAVARARYVPAEANEPERSHPAPLPPAVNEGSHPVTPGDPSASRSSP
jgi:D-alanine-D-alanine ligase